MILNEIGINHPFRIFSHFSHFEWLVFGVSSGLLYVVWWLFGLGFYIKIKVDSDWQVFQACSISFLSFVKSGPFIFFLIFSHFEWLVFGVSSGLPYVVWWLFGLKFSIKIKDESDWQVFQAYSISFFVICQKCSLYGHGTFCL